MYTIGQAHPMKEVCRRVIVIARRSGSFFTDAEVFQELLWRYHAQRRWRSMRPEVEALAIIMSGRIEAMQIEDVELAGKLADSYPRLAARDLVHVAIMQRVGSRHIVTADRAFDAVDWLERLDPMQVEEWQSLVTA